MCAGHEHAEPDVGCSLGLLIAKHELHPQEMDQPFVRLRIFTQFWGFGLAKWKFRLSTQVP